MHIGKILSKKIIYILFSVFFYSSNPNLKKKTNQSRLGRPTLEKQKHNTFGMSRECSAWTDVWKMRENLFRHFVSFLFYFSLRQKCKCRSLYNFNSLFKRFVINHESSFEYFSFNNLISWYSTTCVFPWWRSLCVSNKYGKPPQNWEASIMVLSFSTQTEYTHWTRYECLYLITHFTDTSCTVCFNRGISQDVNIQKVFQY